MYSFFFWDIKSVIWEINGISKPEMNLVDLLLLELDSRPVADALEADSGKFLLKFEMNYSSYENSNQAYIQSMWVLF